MSRQLPPLADAVTAALGSEVERMERLGGGDVALAYRAQLADGRAVFAKTHVDPPPGFFATEAAGLRWIGEPAVLPVPDVLAVDDVDPAAPARVPMLVLSWIDEGGRPSTAGEATFGRQLAALHDAGAPCFGREDRRPTGSRSLPNDPTTTWSEFYAERRLRPLAAMAESAGALGASEITGLRSIADRLDHLGGPPEPPARLHGDLWAGNRLVDRQGTSWLIDPAAHGGHREFDLAMMRLFGGFGAEAFAAYADVHRLAEGWDERIALHQLAPLAVHAIKFGGAYVAATAAAIRQYL